MSQIKSISLILCLLFSLALLALSGCGDKNSQTDFSSNSGAHPAGWLTPAPSLHGKVANNQVATNKVNCTECHGDDFLGGISKVACTKCHLGNDRQVHPLQWGQFAYALHGSFVQQKGTASCANVSCHGSDLTGVAGSGPSCTSCHLGGSPTSSHPAGWNTTADFTSGQQPLHAQYVGSNGTTACRNAVCHGANLQGVFLSGPSCNACHSFTP